MSFHGHSIQFANWANYIPILATMVTTLLSIVLARATLRYAHATDRMLDLTREQFEREWAPELHVRLEKVSATDARVIITNLAKASVLLQLVQLRNISQALPFEKQYLNEPLVGGAAWTRPLGERLMHICGDDFAGTIAASVSFYAAGRLYRTDWFRFHVEARHGSFNRIDPITLPARRVRVLEPHRVRRFRKHTPMGKDVAHEVLETPKPS